MAWKKDDTNGNPEVLKQVIRDYEEMQTSGKALTDFQKRFFEQAKKTLAELSGTHCKICGFPVGESYGTFDDGSVIHEDPSYSGTRHVCQVVNELRNYFDAGGLEEGEAEDMKPLLEEAERKLEAFKEAGGKRSLTLTLTEEEINWLVWKLNNTPVLEAGYREGLLSSKIGEAKRDQWA